MLEYLGSELIRTGYRSPWQNGVAERWVGSCRRDLLDHVIVLNESHLRRLLRDYLQYYNCASYRPPRYVVENPRSPLFRPRYCGGSVRAAGPAYEISRRFSFQPAA